MGSEPNSKRKAAAAAVHAAAAALQEDSMEEEGFGLDESRPPQPYMPTLPPGMQTSASTPQVLCMLFMHALSELPTVTAALSIEVES